MKIKGTNMMETRRVIISGTTDDGSRFEHYGLFKLEEFPTDFDNRKVVLNVTIWSTVAFNGFDYYGKEGTVNLAIRGDVTKEYNGDIDVVVDSFIEGQYGDTWEFVEQL